MDSVRRREKERSFIEAVVVGTFFFQAEDGIRDWSVTGVQTCALPISIIDLSIFLNFNLQTYYVFSSVAFSVGIARWERTKQRRSMVLTIITTDCNLETVKIGRASCRERV